MSICASSSAIVVGTVSGYHLLKIDSYSRIRDLIPSGTWTKSLDFRVGYYTAHIEYYPNSHYISLRLIIDIGNYILNHKRGQVQFSLLDKSGKPVPGRTETITTDLPDTNRQRFTFSAHLPQREDWEQWVLLNGDCFTIRCDFTLMEAPSATTPVQLDLAAPAPAPPSDLHRHLGALLLGGEGADVTFHVGQESFHAHRCVLASRSLVFKAEFFGAMTMKEGSPQGQARGAAVPVDGVEAQAFGAFLHFVYTDALPDISHEEETWMAQHLLVLADRYDMERLKLICQGKLRNRIDVSSVATTLALAEQHHCHGLKEACLDFLELPGNLRTVVSTHGFDHLATSCPAVLREIIAKLAAL
ncbi:BTB/POZ and MATH domain-containing protein 1-like [Lolium rigidum]|uniref:BTB/POZ and MATH domain-containing protein 1-like n=1 Tax=Lolium rigidum TaxID=89674 RepID=UPI001F5D84B8|nr:BTB/POZ and MATH domain-containing protein 1-like [Lolium rigidum]